MNRFKAAAIGLCPRCYQGHMFTPWNYRPFQKQKMNQECEVCHLHYEVESGFFWGAMYFSYALNVAECVTLSLMIYILTGSHSPWLYSGILISFILLAMSFNYRYGRIYMLYLFGNIAYQEQAHQEKTAQEKT